MASIMGIFQFNNIEERILCNSGQSNRKILLMMTFSEGLVGNSDIGSLFYPKKFVPVSSC